VESRHWHKSGNRSFRGHGASPPSAPEQCATPNDFTESGRPPRRVTRRGAILAERQERRESFGRPFGPSSLSNRAQICPPFRCESWV
jgi:hypothetical protein